MSISEEHSCLAAAARHVLALHATSAAAERNWSVWGRQFPSNRATMAVPTGMRAKLVQVNFALHFIYSTDRHVLAVAGAYGSKGPRHRSQTKTSRRKNKLRRDRARKVMNDLVRMVSSFCHSIETGPNPGILHSDLHRLLLVVFEM
jgi:hypothetical protein